MQEQRAQLQIQLFSTRAFTGLSSSWRREHHSALNTVCSEARIAGLPHVSHLHRLQLLCMTPEAGQHERDACNELHLALHPSPACWR